MLSGTNPKKVLNVLLDDNPHNHIKWRSINEEGQNSSECEERNKSLEK